MICANKMHALPNNAAPSEVICSLKDFSPKYIKPYSEEPQIFVQVFKTFKVVIVNVHKPVFLYASIYACVCVNECGMSCHITYVEVRGQSWVLQVFAFYLV